MQVSLVKYSSKTIQVKKFKYFLSTEIRILKLENGTWAQFLKVYLCLKSNTIFLNTFYFLLNLHGR